jgi:hypothetical protein
MATDNYYFERNDHDTSIDSLPSILSERPSHNTLQDLINYNISPKLFNGSDLTYGIEKSVHESREFVRKSANRNFKAPQIDRNSMLSPGRKEYVVEINDQNAFLQPDSKKFMNKKIIKGIKSSKITGNLAPEVTTKQKPKTPNKTAAQKSKTGFQPTNWTSPNMKKLPPNPSTYTIMESSQAAPFEKLNRLSLKSRGTPVPETIYESNLYPSTSTLGEDQPEPKLASEKNSIIVDDFTEEESHDHSIPDNVKPPSLSESMIYKKPKRYGSAFDQAKLNLSINLEEEEEEERTESIIPKTKVALGNKEKMIRPFLGVLEQKLITDDSMMDPPTTPNRTRMLRDYSSFIHGESSIDNLGTNRDNTIYLSPRSEGPQENRHPSSPQSSDDNSFVSCLSYDPNMPSSQEIEVVVQNNSFKKIDAKETTADKDFIKNLLHNIEKENKNPPKNAKTEYRYAATTKAKDQPYLTQLNSQTFKKSLDINKNREAMLKNSYKILKDLDTVWFHSEAERDEIIFKAQPQTTKQTKVPPMKRKPEFDTEQDFKHPCSPKISPKDKPKKFEPVYTERSLTDIVLSNDFQPRLTKRVDLSTSALKINESSQDMSREYANKTDFSISQSFIPCENDEYSYESLESKVKGLHIQPTQMGKKSHPQKVLSALDTNHTENIQKTEKITENWQPESDNNNMFDVYESFEDNDPEDEIIEPNPMRYRATIMDQSQLPIIDEVSSTHMLTASYVDNQPSLAQKNNLTNISIHSDYCLTEPDPNFSRILTDLPQELAYGGSLDNLDLLCYENVQNSSDSNRIINDSIREMNNYSTDEKHKTIGNLLEGLKPELSSLNMNLLKTKSSGTPQASSQRRKLKKTDNTKKRYNNSDFIPQIQIQVQVQREKNLPKKMEKEKKFYETGYDNISREVLMQSQENCLMSRLDKNTESSSINGINAMKTSKQTQSISTTSKAPLKLPKSTNSLTAILPIAKKKLNDKENQERRDAPKTLLRRPDLTKDPLKAKILNSYTKNKAELGYKDENLLSSRNSSLSEIDPLMSNEVLKGQAMCYAGMLNNYNFLDNEKIDVSRKHHK